MVENLRLDDAIAISRLQARIQSLERMLRKSSELIGLLAREVCPDDQKLLHRIAFGQARLPRAVDLSWHETTQLTPSNVESSMTELWKAIVPGKTSGPL